MAGQGVKRENGGKLRITAGLGSLCDAAELAAAGADELFCGYVPLSWRLRYGELSPLNRREVFLFHVQIGTLEDMKLLAGIAKERGIRVSVTFNSLFYTEEQLPIIAGYIRELTEIGFSDFIIADISLIDHLFENDIACNIHLSGEFGSTGIYTLKFLERFFEGGRTKITRIIFDRQTGIEDMKRCISYARERGSGYEFEAFFMNEKCHFAGGFCNSLHCDKLEHICRLEYRVVPYADTPCGGEAGCAEKSQCSCGEALHSGQAMDDEYVPGSSGCGICALPLLMNAGIDYLKIVGRGASPENMRKDIELARMAADAANEGKECKEISDFPHRCGGNCYYL